MKPLGLILGALLCAWAAASQAQQSVYRCGADGRTYSQEPCEAGRLIDVADRRSAEQSTQTRQAAQRDARLAQALQRDREHAEHQASRQAPAIIGSAPKAVVHDTERREMKKKRRHGAAADVTLYRAPQPH
jgi:hypothetical protein